MPYVDASLLVAALTNEASTERTIALLEEQPAGSLAVSEWTITEVAAALSIKRRMGAITSSEHEAALATAQHLRTRNFLIMPVTSAHFRLAARLASEHLTGLRAGDALHLAIASDANIEVWTLDHRMAEAGPSLGIATRLV